MNHRAPIYIGNHGLYFFFNIHPNRCPSTVSCKATNDLDPKKSTSRRDVLFGLGILYYASISLCDAYVTDAKPVSAVDKTIRGRGD
ncbi:hypothetical protein SADUNF_Sadunf11G0027700 [Salix dunnii]|uniref:Uncharacterized protein n=1 Tax=Salix dunnii TaxID=1413687 RepID=A0A835MMR4_9ROSI|nr:hypothetical protein SADUNF_Sadunf11G0027700 [Salix dunnii]